MTVGEAISKDRTAPEAPRWFDDALTDGPAHADVSVEGRRVHLRCWGDSGKPTLALVHGGAAHSGWWDHIAPFLTRTHRVVAVDLGGHGDSERSNEYSLSAWARELVAAATADAPGPVTVVGHSMGGWVSVTAALEYPEDIASVVLIDSPTSQRAPGRTRLRGRSRPARGYASREEITARFTTVPHQDVVLGYVADHVAAESVREIDGRWKWKFDPVIFDSRHLAPIASEGTTLDAMLARISCPAVFLRCERGIVGEQMAADVQAALDQRGVYIELAEAGHHPMLDHPLALVAALRTILQYS